MKNFNLLLIDCLTKFALGLLGLNFGLFGAIVARLL
jgi:hypothetical protein